MLIGQAGVPIRLAFDIADYSTDKGVQCLIYAPGTVAGGETLLSTVNLVHSSAGRYVGFYTPAYNYKYLNLKYIVYTDTTYAEKFIGYAPASEQLVLDSVGGGGGLGAVVKPLNETDYNRIAEEVWKKVIDDITIKGSGAMWVKRNQELDIKPIIVKIDEIKLENKKSFTSLESLVKNIDDVYKMTEDLLKKTLKNDDRLQPILDKIDSERKDFKEVIDSFSKIVDSVEELKSNADDSLNKIFKDQGEREIKVSKEMIDFMKKNFLPMLLDVHSNSVSTLADVIAGLLSSNFKKLKSDLKK